MAGIVRVGEIGYKRRNPWGIVLLAVVTLGIYGLVWYYKANNELRNYGIQNEPTVALLAILLGWLLIVPPFVSYYRTGQRILRAQERAEAQDRISPGLGLAIVLVGVFVPLVGLLVLPYYQTQLNKVWDRLLERGGEVAPA